MGGAQRLNNQWLTSPDPIPCVNFRKTFTGREGTNFPLLSRYQVTNIFAENTRILRNTESLLVFRLAGGGPTVISACIPNLKSKLCKPADSTTMCARDSTMLEGISCWSGSVAPKAILKKVSPSHLASATPLRHSEEYCTLRLWNFHIFHMHLLLFSKMI